MSRYMTETVKIETGAKSAVYMHVDRDKTGQPAGIYFSYPQQFEGQAIDLMCSQIQEELRRVIWPGE